MSTATFPAPDDPGSNFVRMIVKALQSLQEKLNQISDRLDFGVGETKLPEYMTPKQFAGFLGSLGIKAKDETVRQWCRDGRINAKKIEALSGDKQQWRISQDELKRYQAEGLLPPDPDRNR